MGEPAERRPADTASGPGRVLVALYALFTLAAGARAAVQVATRFDEAPVAYLLSALAAVIYLMATIGLVRGGRTGRRTAMVACSVELAGVLVVGTLSLVDRAAFPDATVWSGYGRGYGFVPLVLPVLGLLWLRHQAELAAADGTVPGQEEAGR
jgi:cytochrome bd-type quinol oxidase subunit 2